MRKWKSFKKVLISVLVVAIVLPGWIFGSPIFQKPERAKAAVTGYQTLDDSAGSPDFGMANSINWTAEIAGYNDSSKTTDGTHLGEYAHWVFQADSAGNHLIEVSWAVSSTRAENVQYVLLDSTFTPVADIGGVNSFIIDQTKNNMGVSVVDGTWSDYSPLSVFNLNQYEEYSLVIMGENSEGSVNADSVLVYYDNIAPTNASVNINSGAAYTNSTNVVLNLSATDNNAVQYAAISETTPIPDATVPVLFQNNVNFVLSNGDGPKTVYAQYADIVLNVTPEVSDSIILDTTIAIPANISATLAGNIITIEWDDVIDSGSGLSGYNIYSSVDGFSNKINPSLIPAGTSAFGDTIHSNGNYSYKIEAVDNAGNISAKSALSLPEIAVSNIAPKAPNNVVVEGSNKKIAVSWEGVGGGVTGYIVTINGVSKDVGNTTTYSTYVSEYGTYKVLVTSYYSADNFGINDADGFSQAKNAAIAAGLEKSVVLASIVTTSSVNKVTVAPEDTATAETAVTTQPETTVPKTEEVKTPENTEEGQIKGEEVKEDEGTTDEDFNWTPWIILIIIIALAGAATGGYFYWTRGEENNISEVTVTKKTPTGKSDSSEKGSSGKKSNRW